MAPRGRGGGRVSPYALAWLQAFAFTQLIEAPVYRRAGCGWAGAFAASAITHPAVWFVIFPHAPMGYAAKAAVAEAFAWGAEALWLRHALGVPRAWAWSLLANGLSFGLGLASRALFGWP